MAFRCLSLLTLLIVMYAIHAEPRALRAFSIIGCILDLDHLEEALRKKSPGFDATGAYRSQACAVKGLCQYVVRQCKRAKRTRITTYAVLGRLKARFHDSIHVHMHGKSRRMFCDVFCRFACQDLVGEKLLAVAKRKPKTSAMAGSPDNVETQPLDPGIPAIAAPEFLPQVLLSLESVRPFPHELQYKKPFRSLCRASDSGDPVPLSTYATYACAL